MPLNIKKKAKKLTFNGYEVVGADSHFLEKLSLRGNSTASEVLARLSEAKEARHWVNERGENQYYLLFRKTEKVNFKLRSVPAFGIGYVVKGDKFIITTFLSKSQVTRNEDASKRKFSVFEHINVPSRKDT